MKNYLLNLGLILALITLAGCSTPIGADKVSPRAAYLNLHQNALNSGYFSADTRRVLNRYDLEAAIKSDPDATLEQLQTIACNDERRDVTYALSELSYWNAERERRSVKPGVPDWPATAILPRQFTPIFICWGKARMPARTRSTCDFAWRVIYTIAVSPWV